MANPGNPASAVSPKVTAATLGFAVATLIFFVLGIFDILPPGTSTEAVVGATGATATIFVFVFGYLIRDPVRG